VIVDRVRVRRVSALAGALRPTFSFSVQYVAAGSDLPARPLLRRWASAALERDAVVTLRFVDDAEGRRLNRAYRGSDHATNVLSFVYDDDHGALRGDIVLCAPVLRQEAATQGKVLVAHCAHLLVHGMLHLQGYDHHRAADATRMERREAAILATFGFPDPYVSDDVMRTMPAADAPR
jgi:probable rRNA maturation factor